MKDFLLENRKTVGRLYLNQFGSAFLGMMVSMSATATKTTWIIVAASLFAIAFHLYLVYMVAWERGGLDRIRVDGGRAPYRPLTGVWIALLANAVTILLGICIQIGAAFGETYEWAGNLYALAKAPSMLWNAMYIGIINTYSPHNPIIHLLHILPALFVTAGGYWLGLGNKRLFGFLSTKKAKK